ncbi:P2Y purinoceptor 13-like [Xyrichtys novacula]|uniref:P2Y purinoceptor 13-like n=1 Tax=Xyrichtys novacula TaxID=13765 RepID=A0AAV1FXV7_XYRNO|nr:P2Y purinoceptor 13-like [Xyrichtys novacula]
MASNKTAPDTASFNMVNLDVAVACLFFLLFPVAFLLNGVATWVSLHLPCTSTFIVYLKNLVAADLLMTLMIPPMAASRLPGATVWLQTFDCRFASVIFYCSLYTSITLMGLISLDRFFKIVRPRGKVLGQSVTFSVVTSTTVWIVLFGSTAIPTIILTDQSPENVTSAFCISLKSRAGVTVHSFVVLFMEVLFWLVAGLTMFCYICITLRVLQSYRNSGSNNNEGKKKTKLRVFLILFVFLVCFVPLHIMRIPFTLYEVFHRIDDIQPWMIIGQNLCLWLSSTNACLDPLLYIYLCREFREKLLDMKKAGAICLGLYSSEKEENEATVLDTK